MSSSAWRCVRGVFVGSGSDGLGQMSVCNAIMGLAAKSHPRVCYIGTATYDLPGPAERQTRLLREAGCSIHMLNVTSEVPSDMAEQVAAADIVVVSGGNTLYAVDRWHAIGLVPLLRQAMERSAVLAGGSAGAICWFDGGHSDSMDPTSYRAAMLAPVGDESSAAPAAGQRAAAWKYIRVPSLGFLPGLVCPHHDRKQSNGVMRFHDFDGMLLRHEGERGICIDHWAAIVINGDSYRVLEVCDDQGGTLGPDGGFCSNPAQGRPAVWIKETVDGQVQCRLVPPEGAVADLLRPARAIVDDQLLATARAENPIPG